MLRSSLARGPGDRTVVSLASTAVSAASPLASTMEGEASWKDSPPSSIYFL